MSPCIRLYGTTRDGRLAPSTLSEVVASFTGCVGQMEMRRKRYWFIKRPAETKSFALRIENILNEIATQVLANDRKVL